jgi:hypothetical protein
MNEPRTPPALGCRERPSFPLTVLLALASAVWVVGLLIDPARPSVTYPRARIRSGTAPELAPAIRTAPRAMVYVGCAWSTYSVRGRQRFEETARRLVRDHPNAGIQFFVIENEADKGAEAWAESFRDERLAMLGHLGWGWLLWLEHGRIREVDPFSANFRDEQRVDSIKQTLSLWR